MRWPDYDVFLSYSRVDVGFAATLQRSLERFAKPWHRPRSLRVFRDVSSLAPEAGLWSSIERALEKSSWFILLASPDAAGSPWVNREIAWWVEHRSVDRLLVVRTAGTLEWDDDLDTWDVENATALPPALRHAFVEEPHWVDAAWSRAGASDESRVQDVTASLASAVKGVPRDELVATALVEHRRTIRLARTGVTLLVILLVLALAAGVIAWKQRDTAREQATLAVSRQLAAVSQSQRESNLDASLLLAVEAVRRDDNPQSVSALMGAALASPHLVRYFRLPADVSAMTGTQDGRVIVAGLQDGRVMRLGRGGTMHEVAKLDDSVKSLAVDREGSTIVASDGNVLSDRATAVLVHADGRAGRLAVPAGQIPTGVGVSPSGDTVFLVGEPPELDGARSLSVIDGRDGAVRAIHAMERGLGGEQLIVPSDEEVVVYDGAYGMWNRHAVDSWAVLDRGGVAFGTHQASGDPSADGEYMTATNGAPEIPVWRMHGSPRNERPSRTASAPITNIGALALSADGSRLAVAATDVVYVARTVGAGKPHPAPVELTGIGSVDQLRFLDSGSRLLARSGRALTLWDLTQNDRVSRTVRVPLRGSCGACRGARLAVSPDGTRAAVAGDFGAAAVVDLVRGMAHPLQGDLLGTTFEQPLWAGSTAIFPVDPPVGGTESTPPTLPAGARSWPAGSEENPIVTMTLARSGAAVGINRKGEIFIHRVSDGALLRRISTHSELERGDDELDEVAVAPAGDRVATLLRGRVVVTDVTSGRPVLRLREPEAMLLAFGGDRLFIQHEDGSVDVRSGPRGALTATFPGDRSYVFPPVSNPQGTVLARLRASGQLVLVDADTGATLVTLPPAVRDTESRTGIAFSRDGTHLVTVTTDFGGGPAVLVDRDLSRASLIRSACAAAGHELSDAEWRRFAGMPAPDRATCSGP